MSTAFSDALLAVAIRYGTQELCDHLHIPKRTMDRWVAALRQGDASSWSADHVRSLAQAEFERWGTTGLADAFRPIAKSSSTTERTASSITDTVEVAESIAIMLTAHRHGQDLIAELSGDIADGIIQDHEARRILPLIDVAQEHIARELQSLAHLRGTLVSQLSRS